MMDMEKGQGGNPGALVSSINAQLGELSQVVGKEDQAAVAALAEQVQALAAKYAEAAPAEAEEPMGSRTMEAGAARNARPAL